NVAQVPPELAGRNAAVVKRGADALGWSGDYIFRNARGCVGSGICQWGCPTSAKLHVGVTYVPRAWEAGAVTYTGTRARRLAGEGLMFEGAAGPPDYMAMSLPFSGDRHRELMLNYRHLSQFGVMVSDHSRGSVRERFGAAEISYHLDEQDVATFKRGIELLCE